MPSTKQSKGAKGVVKQLTSIHGGVNPRSRTTRKTTNATKSAAQTSRETANSRMERQLIRDMVGAFRDLGDCESYADMTKNYGVEYPEWYMSAVNAVLRLKHFYQDRKRKGFRYAVFDRYTHAPSTFKQIKDHAQYIFKTARTLNLTPIWHLAKQFRRHKYYDIGFDEVFDVPLCHLQGFQRSGSFSSITTRERKRFVEARRWLEERTPVLVMDLVSSKRMIDLKGEHWSRMLNPNEYNVNYSSLPSLTNKPVGQSPSGHMKRSRGGAPVPSMKRRA